MNDDPEDRPAHRPMLERPPLDGLGIAELRRYIEELQGEISRADAMIARKQNDRDAAEAVFGKR